MAQEATLWVRILLLLQPCAGMRPPRAHVLVDILHEDPGAQRHCFEAAKCAQHIYNIAE